MAHVGIVLRRVVGLDALNRLRPAVGVNPQIHLGAGGIGYGRPLLIGKIHVVGIANHDHAVARRFQLLLQAAAEIQIKFVFADARGHASGAVSYLRLHLARRGGDGFFFGIAVSLVAGVDGHNGARACRNLRLRLICLFGRCFCGGLRHFFFCVLRRNFLRRFFFSRFLSFLAPHLI